MKENNKFVFLVDNNLPRLLNSENYAVGGATVQTSNWMIGFEQNGFKTVVISHAEINKNTDFIIENIKKNSPLTLIKFSLLLLRYSPKFIYVSIPWWSNILLFIPAKILGVKIVQRISNDIFVDDRVNNIFQSKIKNSLFKKSTNYVDVFACQNSYQFERIKSFYPNKKVLKLYNPFSFFEIDQSSKRSYVAWVGIFQKQKNFKSLYDIVKKTPKIKFKIAGKMLNPKDKKTKRFFDLLSNEKNVEFIGLLSRNEIFSFLSNAYCLLNTSLYEGFPNTYLESISVQTPIITRKITDPDNIISSFRLGICVDSFDEIPPVIKNVVNKKYKYGDFHKYLNENHNSKILARKLINKIE